MGLTIKGIVKTPHRQTAENMTAGESHSEKKERRKGHGQRIFLNSFRREISESVKTGSQC